MMMDMGEEETEETTLLNGEYDGAGSDKKADGEYSFEEAISLTGYGKFHYILLALCGWALSSDAIEVLSISFILPPATCDLDLSASDKGWLNAIIFLGMMFGGYIWGTLADINGRRAVLLWSLTVNGLGGLASSLAQSFPVFLVLRFISGVGVGGSLPVIFAYYTEFQPKEKRGSMISFLATFWMCGNIIAAAIAWIIIPLTIGVTSGDFLYNSWRIYLAVCTAPSLTSAVGFLLMPESPKYLLHEKGSFDAIMTLHRVFRSNNPDKNIHLDYPVKAIKDPDMQLKIDRHSSAVSDTRIIGGCCSRGWNRLKMAFTKFYRATVELYGRPFTRRSVIMTVSYFTLSFGYYGLFLWFPELFNRIEKYGGSPCSLGSANETTTNATTECTYDVSNKIYLESFLTAISNLPGNIFTIIVIDKIGRKILLSGSMVVSGVSVFFIALLRNGTQSLIMSCLFSAISVIGWNTLDVLGVELFPTKLRSTGTGIFTSVGRIGAVLGNVAFGELVEVYCIIPMILVATLLSFGGLLSIGLPNTTMIDLPD